VKRPIKRAASTTPTPVDAARTLSKKLSERATKHEAAARSAARLQGDVEAARTRALNAHLRARRAAKKVGDVEQVDQHHKRVVAHREALAGAKPKEQSE